MKEIPRTEKYKFERFKHSPHPGKDNACCPCSDFRSRQEMQKFVIFVAKISYNTYNGLYRQSHFLLTEPGRGDLYCLNSRGIFMYNFYSTFHAIRWWHSLLNIFSHFSVHCPTPSPKFWLHHCSRGIYCIKFCITVYNTH